jgi:hypothetical protein
MTTIATPVKSITAKSVVEKLKSLSSSTAQKTLKGLEEIPSELTSTIGAPSVYSTMFSIFKYIVLIILFIIVLLNLLSITGLLSPKLVKIYNPILLVRFNSAKKETTNDKSPTGSQQQADKPATTINTIPSDNSYDNPVIKALEDALKKTEAELDIKDDNSGSRIQSAQSKSGFCYIGEDRGFRSCIKVTERNTCMSGDIFPTEDICINPKLRQ